MTQLTAADLGPLADDPRTLAEATKSHGSRHLAARRAEFRRKATRAAIEFAVWQADFIRWQALAESFKRDLAAFDAGTITAWRRA